ncbi:16696_t:CDS:2, partial [Cetraspora pellucida]
NMCNNFAEIFHNDNVEALPPKFSHNSTWKERKEVLSDITEEILYFLEFAEGQSEGTYVTDVIMPLIRSALKKLPMLFSARKNIDDLVDVSKLTWKDPIASMVLSDDSAVVEILSKRQRRTFL